MTTQTLGGRTWADPAFIGLALMLVRARLIRSGADPDIFAPETIRYWLAQGKSPAEVVAILLGTP